MAGYRDVLKASQRRCQSLQLIEESVQSASLPLHLDLDIARGIAYPSLEIVLGRKLVDKRAEANSLHHTAHADAQKL
jgi:hypothetical protein